MASLFSPITATRPSSPPPATPTTDFALIESQKENIRPLASGRSAVTLSTLFEKDIAAEKVIQDGGERCRRDIEEAEQRDREGEDMVDGVQDVMDVYNRYILFTVQHHPSSATHLLPLLESTTRRFLTDARYGQDVRYLKLWVMYTRHVERREEVWAFLESRDVGTRHAVFYEEWAGAAEGLGRRKKADEIYRLGIARKAAPLERLKGRHQAFLERLMMSATDSIPDDEPSLAPAPTSARSVLGSATSVSGATQLAPSNRLSKSANGAKMEIFSDAAGTGEDAVPGEWADLGTRDGRRKENTVEAGPWKGETLPQSAARGRIAPRTPKVEVFKDSNDNEAVRSADDVFAKSKQPPTEADLLKYDPLRHYDTSSVSTTVPTIPSLPAAPSTRKPPKPPKASSSQFVMQPWECPTDGPEVNGNGGKIERKMMDWNNVYKNGEEWSFEEVRARQRGLLGKEWRGDLKQWESGWHKPGSSTPKEAKKKSMPSPTVNTKLANEEVLRMFDQTIRGGKVRDSDSESDEDGSDEEEAPVHTAPTPLPARPATATMLAPAGGTVPPTPTPASGHVTQNRPLQLSVYSDENAPPAATNRINDENAAPPLTISAAKLNIFSDTPAKAPLADRTSLVASGSQPRAFGVFSEEPPTPRQPLGAVNAFATPALSEKMPGRGTALASVIPEEAEEDDEQVLTRVIEEHHVNINDEEDEEDPPPRRRRFNIDEMTPITERTCEFTTQMTTLRSSQFGTTSSTRRTSTVPSEVDADEAFVASDPAATAAGLSAVVEEEDRPSPSAERSDTPDQSVNSVSPPTGHRSGSVGSGFQLPEGFTIHNQGHTAMTMHTMVLVDGAATETMHTAREGSPDSAFFTASAPLAELANPCNPADDDVIVSLLASVDPPLSALPGFHDHRDRASGRLDSLQQHAKVKVRRASTSSRVSAVADEPMSLQLAGKTFQIQDKIGEGGFGAVFLAVDVVARQLADDESDDEDDEDDEDENKCLVAIKVEKPASLWEAVVLDRIHRRLDEAYRSSIIRPRNLFAFADESFLLLDYSSQGTLLDLVNKATQMGIAPAVAGAPSAVDELLAIFFTIELLKLVESLHSANFIHGDLKIDNCLVRLELTNSASWSPKYDRFGETGWSTKGVKLIDFGRAIDLDLFPARTDQIFVADWKTDERDCVEMREARPWSYQTDYFGLASVCYCLLFGKYISTEVAPNPPGESGRRYKIATPLKRYWQTNLWNTLFDALLNPKTVRADDKLPITGELGAIRVQLEDWLEENCQKGGKSLKAMLKKVELAAITGRRG